MEVQHEADNQIYTQHQFSEKTGSSVQSSHKIGWYPHHREGGMPLVGAQLSPLTICRVSSFTIPKRLSMKNPMFMIYEFIDQVKS